MFFYGQIRGWNLSFNNEQFLFKTPGSQLDSESSS